MYGQLIPVMSDNVTVIAPQAIPSGSCKRGTLDLRNRQGAFLTSAIAKGGTRQPATALGYRVRRLDNGGAAGTLGAMPATVISPLALNTGTVSTGVVAKDAALGASSVTVAVKGSFAAQDLICITDAAFTRTELHYVTRVTAASQIIFDSPLLFAHGSTAADKVRRLTDLWGPVWLPGGSMYEVICDYGAATSGDPAHIMSRAVVYCYDRETS